jgi:hypothetical protein
MKFLKITFRLKRDVPRSITYYFVINIELCRKIISKNKNLNLSTEEIIELRGFLYLLAEIMINKNIEEK